ncbi:MAG: hypothetical protein ACI82S_002929, partial [Patiriisocius sp.]
DEWENRIKGVATATLALLDSTDSRLKRPLL